jgi:guanylate kinase
MRGRLVILSGPSGVGKDTVLPQWAMLNPLVERVVATTTRPPRAGEVDGVDYDFVSENEFQGRVTLGEFLEHKLVHGHYYGTPVKSVQRLLDAGKIAVLKIDVQGAAEVMAKRPDAVGVFLLPPNMKVLEQRIRQRATDDEATILVRLANAAEEIELADRYTYQVVNGDLGRAVREIDRLVWTVPAGGQ